MATVVYVVRSWCSDYRTTVHGVFSTEALADQEVAMVNASPEARWYWDTTITRVTLDAGGNIDKCEPTE